jgi:hypothetical protein
MRHAGYGRCARESGGTPITHQLALGQLRLRLARVWQFPPMTVNFAFDKHILRMPGKDEIGHGNFGL